MAKEVDVHTNNKCTPPHTIFTVGLACDGVCIIRDACHLECILYHIQTL